MVHTVAALTSKQALESSGGSSFVKAAMALSRALLSRVLTRHCIIGNGVSG